jgi:hypothetical protein
LKRPVTPDTPSLVEMARLEPISLDWLLLGEGVPRREPLEADESLSERLRAAILQAITSRGVSGRIAEMLLPPADELLDKVEQ